MYLLSVNLYALGQFLRIALWIFLPVFIIATLITTWIQYRRKQAHSRPLLLAIEGMSSSSMEDMGGGEEKEVGGTNQPDRVGKTSETEIGQAGAENENLYQGILWMKDKYEQYRDEADKRYELMKEKLDQSEQKYQDLINSLESDKIHSFKGEADKTPSFIEETGSDTGIDGGVEPIQLDQRIKNDLQLDRLQQEYDRAQQELEARQVMIDQHQAVINQHQAVIDQHQAVVDELERQLRAEQQKVEEMVTKLQINSQLLLNIYQELDKSLKAKTPEEQP